MNMEDIKKCTVVVHFECDVTDIVTPGKSRAYQLGQIQAALTEDIMNIADCQKDYTVISIKTK